MRKSVFLFLLGAFCIWIPASQGASEEGWPERIRGKVYKMTVQPKWKGSTFWYMNRLSGGRSEYIFVDALKGERRPAFDAERLARSLREKLGRDIDPERLGLENLDYETEGKMSFRLGSERWQCDLGDYTLSAYTPAEADISTAFPTRMKRSRSTGESLFLSFINDWDSPITISWVNTEGEERTYATIRPGAEHQQHTFAGHVWKVTDPQGRTLAILEAQTDGDYFRFTEEKIKRTLEEAARETQAPREDRPGQRTSQFGASSPDGAWSVELRENNVYLVENSSGEAVALTRDGDDRDGYEPPILWSPDGKYFILLKTRRVQEREIYMVESSPKDQLQPKLHTHRYAKPGDELAYKRPKLFSVERKEPLRFPRSCRAIPGIFPNSAGARIRGSSSISTMSAGIRS